MPKLSLYVWPEFYTIHDAEIAFAVALSEDHAKDLIIAKQCYTRENVAYIEWGPLKVYELTEPMGRALILGR